MDGARAGIILRAGRLTVQRMFELRTVRNASYCILGLNCSSEDSAQYRKLDSLVKPTISATAGVPYPTRKFDAQKKVPLRVGAWRVPTDIPFNIAEAEQTGAGRCDHVDTASRRAGSRAKNSVRKIKTVTPRVGCWPMMRTDVLPNNRFTYIFYKPFRR